MSTPRRSPSPASQANAPSFLAIATAGGVAGTITLWAFFEPAPGQEKRKRKKKTFRKSWKNSSILKRVAHFVKEACNI